MKLKPTSLKSNKNNSKACEKMVQKLQEVKEVLHINNKTLKNNTCFTWHLQYPPLFM